MTYTVRAYRSYRTEIGFLRQGTPIFELQVNGLTAAKKECLHLAKSYSGLYFQIAGESSDLWFVARTAQTYHARKKELVELQAQPMLYDDALAARQHEVDTLTKKVSALESQVTSLTERVQSAQSSVVAGNQSAMTYQQRVAAAHAQPYRDESPRYSEQPGRSYDHRGYYREQRSPQGPYATYRPDGSEDTGFDR